MPRPPWVTTRTGFRISLSRYVVERFQERVRPGLGYEDAFLELLRLVGRAADVRSTPPEWMEAPEDSVPDAYVVIGDVALIGYIRAVGGVTRIETTTCVTRTSFAEGAHEGRRARRARRSETRRAIDDGRMKLGNRGGAGRRKQRRSAYRARLRKEGEEAA